MDSAFATILVVQRPGLCLGHGPRLLRIQPRPVIHWRWRRSTFRGVERQTIPRLALLGQNDLALGFDQLSDLGKAIAQVANGGTHSETGVYHEPSWAPPNQVQKGDLAAISLVQRSDRMHRTRPESPLETGT